MREEDTKMFVVETKKTPQCLKCNHLCKMREEHTFGLCCAANDNWTPAEVGIGEDCPNFTHNGEKINE